MTLIYQPGLRFELSTERLSFVGNLRVVRTPIGRFYWADRWARPYLTRLLHATLNHPERLDFISNPDTLYDARITAAVRDQTEVLRGDNAFLRRRNGELHHKNGELQNDVLALQRTIRAMSKKASRRRRC